MWEKLQKCKRCSNCGRRKDTTVRHGGVNLCQPCGEARNMAPAERRIFQWNVRQQIAWLAGW